MKKLKKLTVVGIAAALMVISCAAAVVTGFDQRLADYFGASPEQMELLAPGAQAVDITVEDNGSTLHITQVLKDRYTIMVLADFIAPEGTVLDMGHSEQWGYTRFGSSAAMPQLFGKNGAELNADTSCGHGWKILDDGDSTDNSLTMLFSLSVTSEAELDQKAAYFLLEAKDLIAYDLEAQEDTVLCTGNWSAQIPLPEQDIGQVQKVDGAVVKEIYLSPMTVQVVLDRTDRQYADISRKVTLTDRDGQAVPTALVFGASIDAQTRNEVFSLADITDPARFKGGTLTLRIGDSSVDIPLDNLTPAE